ncbi:lytic murein transglycosylase [Methylocapsa polymorpha]|uniref:Lytic murein transglycosylase n=1 Tax=Methylocapsa polymorpha TaxID=3080828 RepID=A0ABZ0HQ64_9HYPH|nr:lytic murein transglycosylase [Methylocapsa sp. RX1]
MRRLGLILLLAVSLCTPAQAGAAERSAPASAEFQQFLQAIWPLAQAKGVRRETFDAALQGLEPDPAAPTAASKQAEFDKPLSAYLAEAVSAQRIQRGRAALKQWDADLVRIEPRFGVPREILVATFGVESDYGRAQDGKDLIRSLATLAFKRQDRALFLDEFVSALVILDKGEVPRARLTGSWAGAMGGPQFIPSAYLKYAVSADGSAFPDIWGRPQDSLASIANFLRQSGWRPGLPWGIEVILPQNFDFASLHRSFADFANLGVVSADKSPLPSAGEATLFLPSGAQGPAFLLSENYWVLKQYNNSDSYAVSLGLLADRIKGEPGLRGHWPAGEVFLSRTQKAEIQSLLEKLGFYKGSIDGRFGQASRDAIHDFQIGVKVAPADGYGSMDVLRRLREAADGSVQ